jgi:hypothetical protein
MMSPTYSFRGKVFLAFCIGVLVATMCLFPATARATALTSVTVDCDNPAAPYHKISAAVNDPSLGRPLEIIVTGTCLERVTLGDGGLAEESVYIHPPDGQRAAITPPAAVQGQGNVVTICGAHGIFIERLDISGGNAGVFICDASEVDFLDVTVQNNVSTGVSVFGNSIVFFSGSSATSSSSISNNGVTGVDLGNQGSNTALFFGAVVENNGQFGVNAGSLGAVTFSGLNVVRNNGGNTTAITHGGIHATRNSAVRFQPNKLGNVAEITGNTGPGILAEVNSSVSLQAANIHDNSGQGVYVRTQSVLEVVGQDTFTNNGIANITCDAWSLFTGDPTGIKALDCRNIDIPPKK